MFSRFARVVLLIVASAAVMASPALAITWPDHSDYLELTNANGSFSGVYGDSPTDTQGEKNLVGDSDAAAYFYNDGTNVFFKIRLSDDPTGSGGQGKLTPFGYGFELDTDNVKNTYEFYIEIDGKSGTEAINVHENTTQLVVDSPSDEPEVDYVYQDLLDTNNNYRVTTADTSYSNPTGQDYFLEWSMPLTDFLTSTGLTVDSPVRAFIGSSPSGGALQESGGDLIDPGTLAAAFSDPFTVSGVACTTGTVKFVADSAGAGDVTSFTGGDTIYLRVDDGDRNTGKSSAQTVIVTLTTPGGDTLQVTLTETGNNTGIFVGSASTALGSAASDTTLQVLVGETVTVTYKDKVDGEANTNILRTDTAVVKGTDATVSMPATFTAGDTITLTVNDPDRNTSAGATQSVTVSVQNLRTNELETATLTETGNNTGVFSGTLDTAEGASAGSNGDDELNVTRGDDVRTSYFDQFTSSASSTTRTTQGEVLGAVLELTKSASISSPKPGDTVVYTLSYENTGNTTGFDVVVSDAIPANTAYEPSSIKAGATTATATALTDDPDADAGDFGDTTANTVTVAIGNLAAGASGVVQFSVVVDSGIAQGTQIQNVGAVRFEYPDGSPQGPTDSTTATVTASQVASVDVSPATSSVTGIAGTTVSFPATITNNGNGTDTIALSTSGLPTGWTATLIRDTNGNGVLDAGETSVVSSTGSLAAGGTYKVIVRVFIPASAGQNETGDVTLTATSGFDATKSDTGVYTTNVNKAVLAMTKTASPSNPRPGDTVTYTLAFTNTGDAEALDTVVTDGIPAGTTYVAGSIESGATTATASSLTDDADADAGSFASNTVTVSAGTLGASSSGVVIFQVTVDSGTAAGATIDNVAAVSHESPDGTPRGPTDSTTATITASQVAAVQVTPATSSTAGAPCTSVTYPVTITNDGNGSDNFTLTTTGLPTGWTAELIEDTNGNGALDSGENTVVTSTGSLAAGASFEAIVRVSVPCSAVQSDTGTVTVEATSTADNTKKDSGTYETTADSPPQVVSVSVTPATSSGASTPCASVTFAATVTNDGNGSDSFTLTTTGLPTGWTAELIEDANGNGSLESNETTVVTSTGSLAAGASFKAIVRVTVPCDAAQHDTGTVTLTATSGTDGTKTDSGSYTTTVNSAVIAVTKTATPSNASPGGTITYNIVLQNSGTATAFDATLTDAIPANTTYVAGSLKSGATTATASVLTDASDSDAGSFGGGGVSVSLGSIAPSSSAAVVFQVTVDESTPAGTAIDNVAVTSYECPDGNPKGPTSSTTATVGTSQLAAVDVTPPTSSAAGTPGASVAFPACVANRGNGSDSFTLTTTGLPSGWSVTLVRDDNSNGVLDGGETTIVSSTGSLPAGGTFCLIARVSIPPGASPGDTGGLTLVATSVLDPSKKDQGEYTVTAAAATVGLIKTASPSNPKPGDTVTYTLLLANNGNATAFDSVVTDDIPANATYKSGTIKLGATSLSDAADSDAGSFSGNNVTVALGNVAVGASRAVEFQVVVSPAIAAGTTIPNVASLQYESPDGTPQGPTASTTATVAASQIAAVDVTPATSSTAGIAGTTIEFPATITNNGNGPDSFTLTVSGLPAGWTASVVSSTGTLAPGGSFQAIVRVSIPANAGQNDTGAVTLTATSTFDPTKSDSGVYTTSLLAASVALTKTAAPTDPKPGDTVTYVIGYSNPGNSTAFDAEVTDAIPAGTTYKAGTLKLGATGLTDGADSDAGEFSSGAVKVALGNLAGGGSGTLEFQVTIDAATAPGAIANVAQSKFELPDGTPRGPFDGPPAQITVQAPVQVAGVDVTPATASSAGAAGGTVSYRATVTNTGTGADTFALSVSGLPVGWTATIVTDTENPAPAASTGSLAAGGTFAVIVRVSIPGDAQESDTGTVTLEAVSALDSNVRDRGIYSTTVLNAAVTLTKTATPANPKAGDTVTYVVGYTNTGSSTAFATKIRDALPAGMTYKPGTLKSGATALTDDIDTDAGQSTQGTVQVALGDLGAAATGTIEFQATVDANVAAGTVIANIATVDFQSPNGTPRGPFDGPPASVTVAPPAGVASLTLTKTANPQNPKPGDTVTYVVGYTNTGTGTAFDATITDALPANTTYKAGTLKLGSTALSDAADTDAGQFSAGTVSVALGEVATGVGGSIEFQVTVDANTPAATTIANVARAGFESPDGTPRGPFDGPVANVTVIEPPARALTVTKEQSAALVGLGDTVDYTLTVANSGQQSVAAVQLEDPLPPELQFVSASDGGALDGSTVRWTIGELAVGASASRTLKTRLATNLTQGTQITNVASAQGDGVPPSAGPPVVAAVAQGPALALVKATDRPVTTPNGELGFTLDYSNTGGSTAFNAFISDPVPARTTFVSATAGGQLVNGNVRFQLGNLTPGASGQVSFKVRLDGDLPNGHTIENSAVIRADNDVEAASNAVAAPVQRDLIAGIDLIANPEVIRGDGTSTSTLTAAVKLGNGQPAPDGTPVTFRTPFGFFPGGVREVVVLTSGGVAVTILTSERMTGAGERRELVTATAGTPLTGIATDDVLIIFAPASVNGVVTLNDGTPVAGVQVTLFIDSNGNGEVDPGEQVGDPGVTDANGGYSLPVPNTGNFMVRVRGTSPGGVPVNFALPVPPVTQLFGSSYSPSGSLIGTLREEVGRSVVSGCTVMLFDSTGNTIGTTTTNERGVYAFTGLAVGSYQVGAECQGQSGPAVSGRVPVTLAREGEAKLDADLAVTQSGIVFDATTDARIPDATVTLLNAATNQPVTLDANGAAMPNPRQTDAQGNYMFNPPAGTYIVTVTAPGYRPFRSAPITVTNLPVALAIPMVPDLMRISKVASQSVVSPGDIIAYQVVVDNQSAVTATDVFVTDTLPMSFTFLQGSAQVNGIPVANPAGGGTLTFRLPDLPARSRAVLSYRLAVGPSARRGRGVNSAAVVARLGAGTITSGPAQATVEINQGIFYEESILIGRVYIDRNANGRYEKDDVPVANARVWLEDGTSAFTDVEGRYSIEGLSRERHVVVLDPVSLPGSADRFKPYDDGFLTLGNAWSRLTLGRAGTLIGVDFALVDSKPEEALEYVLPAGQPAGTFRSTAPAVTGGDGQYAPALPNGAAPFPATGEGQALSKPTAAVAPFSKQQPPFPRAQRPAVAGAGLSPATTFAEQPSLAIVADAATLVADGKRSGRIEIRPAGAADGELVTVALDGVLALNKDADLEKDGLQVPVQGGAAVVHLEPSARTGIFTVAARYRREWSKQQFRFFSDLRDLIVFGVGSLELGRRDTSGSPDGFADLRELTPGRYDRSRAAFFAKGRVMDDYLLTVALDTAKQDRQRLFRDLDVDRFYPMYGDSSRIERDAQSASKLYLKLEKDEDYLLWGDYHTGFLDNELAAYNRRFTGFKAEKHTEDFDLTLVASESDQRQVRDIIRGGGNSGPYFLSALNVIIGSEQLRVEVRDRRFVEVVRSSRVLVRNVDYTINYFEGTILFKEPVPYETSAFEPVFIVAHYEVRPGANAPKQKVFGGRGVVHLGDDVSIGGTRVSEDDRMQDFDLKGLDATVDLGRFTLRGEWAETDSLLSPKGDGYRLHLAGKIDEVWRVDAVYRNLDPTYRNLSNQVGDPGEERFGLALEGRPTEDWRYLATYTKRHNALRGEESENVSLEAQHRIEEGLTMNAGVEKLDRLIQAGNTPPGLLANPRSFNDFPSIAEFPGGTPLSGSNWLGRLGLEKKASDRLTLRAEREQPLSGTRATFPAANTLSARWALTADTDLVASARTEDFGYFDRALGSLGVETRVDEDTFAFSRYTMSALERGLENFASYGIRTRKQVNRDLGASISYETSDNLDGESPTDFHAIGLGLSYVTPDREKNASARYERRYGSSGSANLFELGGGAEVATGHTLLGKVLFSDVGGVGLFDIRNRQRVDTIVAWAFRPTWTDMFDALFQWRSRDEMTALFGFPADAGADILSLDLHMRATDDVQIDFRHAAKFAELRGGGDESTLRSDLDALRLSYRIAPRWDVAVEGRRLNQGATRETLESYGVELGYEVFEGVRLGGGYNFSGFDDPDLTAGHYTAKGPVARIDFKLTKF